MKTIGIVVQPGFSVMALATVTAFEVANHQLAEPAYAVRLLSEAGGLTRSASGIDVATEAFDRRKLDTLLVTGGIEFATTSPGLVAFLKAGPARYRRIGSLCTGAFHLAAAGLLDGRRATTHWGFAQELRRKYPAIEVDDDRIFIRDGDIWTSAGMTAALDLALALIEDDLGAEAARTVAKKLVIYHRRSGGQSQHSVLLDLDAKSDRVQRALDYAKRNLERDLSVPQLAKAAHLSPRQFSRAFLAETGQSPAKAVEHLRVEAARLMMEEGHYPVEQIARTSGFGDADRMRHAFLRAFGQPPQVMQRASRTSRESVDKDDERTAVPLRRTRTAA